MPPADRRGLVHGAARLSAMVPAGAPLAATPELRGTRFDLRLDQVATNRTGTAD